MSEYLNHTKNYFMNKNLPTLSAYDEIKKIGLKLKNSIQIYSFLQIHTT